MKSLVDLIGLLVYELGGIEDTDKLEQILYLLSQRKAIPTEIIEQMEFECMGCMGMAWHPIYQALESALQCQIIDPEHANNYEFCPGINARKIADHIAYEVRYQETIRVAAVLNGYSTDILKTAGILYYAKQLDKKEGDEVLEELRGGEHNIESFTNNVDRAIRLLKMLESI